MFVHVKMSLCTGGGGGGLNTSVVHIHDQRNIKNGLFLRLNAILENRNYGTKFTYFLERVPFEFHYGHLGVIFKLLYFTLHVPQKILFRG